jgi:catechol 2,3-dioxygenase-like lactoylglutathione lyase family enzyme
MAESQTTTHINKVGTVIVTVNDQDRGLEFFTDKLGFEKRTDVAYGDGERWVDVGPPGGDTTIAVVPPMGETTPGGHTGIGFVTDDVRAAHADLKDRGVDVDEEIMPGGGPVPAMFWFRDPDANIYLLVQSMD